MRKINKITNIALIFMLIVMALGQNLAYSEEACLRVPSSIKYDSQDFSKKFKKAANKKPEVTIGEFQVPGTYLSYNVRETTNLGEIEETLNKWFSEEKYRNRNIWDLLIKKYILGREYPNGFFVKLESSDGEILGMGFFHKEDKFMFSLNIEKTEADISSIYFFDAMEVKDKYINKDLEKVLVAAAIKKSFNDPKIGNRILLSSEEKFFEKMGAVAINMFVSMLKDDIEASSQHYIFYRENAKAILKEVLTTYKVTGPDLVKRMNTIRNITIVKTSL